MTEWQPAFAGQRPPWTEGNTASVRHGAFSSRLVEPAAQELVEQWLADEDNHHLAAPRYRPTLLNCARLQIRADRFGAYLDTLEVEAQMQPPRGGAQAPVQVWQGLVKAATNAADRLGLTPVSHARLAKDMASTAAMTALGARHPLRAALERISEERAAIEGTVTHPEVVEAVSDDLGADHGV